MKYVLATILACLALGAHAQTTIVLAGSSCNVAQTICSITDDAGDAMTFAYSSATGTVSLVVTSVNPDMTTSTVTYTGPVAFGAATTNTLYRVVTPFTVALSPPAVLEGNVVRARSGSGRGGWAWHTHWEFDTLTVY